jgi:hypothetical protein
MNDQDLLTALGKLARERKAADRGSGADANLGQTQPEPSSDHESKQALLEIARAGLAQQPASADRGVVAPSEQGPTPPASGNVIAWRRRSARAWIAGASTVLAAAAALVIWLRVSGGPELPGYTMSMNAGRQAVRGTAAAPDGAQASFGKRSTILITLRPDRPVHDPLDLQAYVVRGSDVRKVSLPFEVSEDGSVRIRGTRKQLFEDVPDGTWEVVLVVGRPGTLQGGREMVGGTAGEQAGSLRVVRRTVVFEGE